MWISHGHFLNKSCPLLLPANVAPPSTPLNLLHLTLFFHSTNHSRMDHIIYFLCFFCLFIVCLPLLECRSMRAEVSVLFTHVSPVPRTVSDTSGHSITICEWAMLGKFQLIVDWIKHGQEWVLKIGDEFGVESSRYSPKCKIWEILWGVYYSEFFTIIHKPLRLNDLALTYTWLTQL